jgi:hypothetical protein
MRLDVRHEAEIAHMERVLRSYGGVLTRERLLTECGAHKWPVLDNFRVALDDAIAAGRVIPLGSELVEVPTET